MIRVLISLFVISILVAGCGFEGRDPTAKNQKACKAAGGHVHHTGSSDAEWGCVDDNGNPMPYPH